MAVCAQHSTAYSWARQLQLGTRAVDVSRVVGC